MGVYQIFRLILRISVSDPTALFQLSKKYGADPTVLAPQLMKQAKEMGLNVVGISFHVGSMCQDPSAYDRAISAARTLFNYGMTITVTSGLTKPVFRPGTGLLHDGAGYWWRLSRQRLWPLQEGRGETFLGLNLSFKITNVIRESVDTYFSDLKVEIIAEPGRYFACSPFAAIANIFHAKEVPASTITDNGT